MGVGQAGESVVKDVDHLLLLCDNPDLLCDKVVLLGGHPLLLGGKVVLLSGHPLLLGSDVVLRHPLLLLGMRGRFSGGWAAWRWWLRRLHGCRVWW